MERLKLSASSSGLYDLGRELPIIGTRVALDSPSVPLADILPSDELQEDDTRRLLLSYLLSKAVWQFYESELVPEHWDKHAVHFMRQEKDLLENRPFLSAEFDALVSSRKFSSLADSQRGTHIFPKVLALGVLLLEIELGQGIEQYITPTLRDFNGAPKENAVHLTVGEIIKSSEWTKRIKKGKTYKFVGDAIETCVRPDTTQLGTDSTQVQAKLYHSVVAKFEFMLEKMYGGPKFIDLEPMRHPRCASLTPMTSPRRRHQVLPDIYDATNELCTNTALLSFNAAVCYVSPFLSTTLMC